MLPDLRTLDFRNHCCCTPQLEAEQQVQRRWEQGGEMTFSQPSHDKLGIQFLHSTTGGGDGLGICQTSRFARLSRPLRLPSVVELQITRVHTAIGNKLVRADCY